MAFRSGSSTCSARRWCSPRSWACACRSRWAMRLRCSWLAWGCGSRRGLRCGASCAAPCPRRRIRKGFWSRAGCRRCESVRARRRCKTRRRVLWSPAAALPLWQKPCDESRRRKLSPLPMSYASIDFVSVLADSVTGAQSLEELVRPLLELLQAVTGLESTYLTRIDTTAGGQHVVYARNTLRLQIPEGLEVPWEGTLCKRALEEGRLYTDDVANCWADSEAAMALGIATYTSTPVRIEDGTLYGTLCAASGERKPLADGAEKILYMFSRLIGQQIERERLVHALRQANDSLAVSALTDTTTH